MRAGQRGGLGIGQLPTWSSDEYWMPHSFLTHLPSTLVSRQLQPHLYLGLSSSLLITFWSTMSRTQMRIGKKAMPMFVLRYRFCKHTRHIQAISMEPSYREEKKRKKASFNTASYRLAKFALANIKGNKKRSHIIFLVHCKLLLLLLRYQEEQESPTRQGYLPALAHQKQQAPGTQIEIGTKLVELNSTNYSKKS